MCIDHPEFRAGLQTISVKHMRALQFLASRTGGELEIQRSKIAATANLSDRQDT
jgi:hypothetical protein